MAIDERTKVLACITVDMQPAPGGSINGGSMGFRSATRTAVGVCRLVFTEPPDLGQACISYYAGPHFIDITPIDAVTFDITVLQVDGVTPTDSSFAFMVHTISPGQSAPVFANTGP